MGAGFTMARQRLSKRGVALIISAFMLILMTITLGVIFYAYSNRILGGLVNVNPPETMDNLRIEAYNWNTPTSYNTVNLTVRNIGTNVLTLSSAHWFVGGIMETAVGCSVTLSPGISCTAKISITGLTVTYGIVYVVKIVLSDGAIFTTSAIAGQVTGQSGVP
jgi:hypothetical protein